MSSRELKWSVIFGIAVEMMVVSKRMRKKTKIKGPIIVASFSPLSHSYSGSSVDACAAAGEASPAGCTSFEDSGCRVDASWGDLAAGPLSSESRSCFSEALALLGYES